MILKFGVLNALAEEILGVISSGLAGRRARVTVLGAIFTAFALCFLSASASERYGCGG